MRDLILKVCGGVVLLMVAAGLGYMGGAGISAHSKSQTVTITKTEIQYVDRIVEKKVYVTDKTKIDTVITKPDGTVEHTVVQNDVNTNTQSNESVKIQTQTTEATTVNPVPSAGLLWLPLNINGGTGVTASRDVVAMLDVTLAGWGTSKRDMSFKFLSVGGNYDKVLGWGLHLTPVSYRLIPKVLTNTYLGAGGFVRLKEKGLFINLSVGL